jgi:hypothetical protein
MKRSRRAPSPSLSQPCDSPYEEVSCKECFAGHLGERPQDRWHPCHLTGARARAGGGTERAGELRFVVMEADAYQRLRECELEIALQEARADFAAGRIVHESVTEQDFQAIGSVKLAYGSTQLLASASSVARVTV